MPATGDRDALRIRTLDDLIAQGKALIEARKTPATAAKLFSDFGDAYQRWNVAGGDIIAKCSGRSAAREWSAGRCRAMYSPDEDAADCLREQERQQGMLVELRARFGAPAATPPALHRAPTKPAAHSAGPTPRGAAAASARASEEFDPLFVLRRDSRDLTNEDLLEDLRRAAADLGKKSVKFEEYPRHLRCGTGLFIKRFGSWNNALTAAGLEVSFRRGISVEELFENLARVWQALGRQPLQSDMTKPLSEFSSMPYHRHFGTWLGALRAFAAWAKEGRDPGQAGAPKPPAPRKTPRQPTVRLRFAVFQRDSFRCTACGKSPATDPATRLHADHKVPWSRGGQTTLENLTTLCEKCNLGKADSG